MKSNLTLVIAVLITIISNSLQQANAQWQANGANIYNTNTGNVGIKTSIPGFPLTFSDALGDKISLWGSSGVHYGFGVQNFLFQIYADGFNSDIAFGHGSSGAFTERMRIKGNGNVGIKTSTPGFPLTFSDALGDKISLWGSKGVHYGFGVQNFLLQIHSDNFNSDIAFGYGSSSAFTERMRIKGNGNVGIGTLSPAYKLSVNGTIQAKEIRVESNWADYVFEKNYNLMPLENVAAYVEKNKHLPGINSTKDIQKNGLAVADMQTKMMAKIEELTLYLIQQNQQIQQLKGEIEQLKK